MGNTKKKSSLKVVRLQVFRRDEWTCWYCGRLVLPPDGRQKPKPNTATLDHLLPTSKGGSDDVENLVTACMSCNCQKGDKTVEEYRAYLRYVCTKQGRAIASLQMSLLTAVTPFDDAIQQAIDWLEGQMTETRFFGEAR